MKYSLSLLECVFIDVKRLHANHSKEFVLPHQAAIIKGPEAFLMIFSLFLGGGWWEGCHLISALTLVRAFDDSIVGDGTTEAAQCAAWLPLFF